MTLKPYSHTGQRVIATGRDVAYTSMTPKELAVLRARRIDSLSDQGLFMDTFLRVRKVALDMPDLDTLLTLMGGRHMDPVMEAALIEALASLRAEGHFIP